MNLPRHLHTKEEKHPRKPYKHSLSLPREIQQNIATSIEEENHVEDEINTHCFPHQKLKEIQQNITTRGEEENHPVNNINTQEMTHTLTPQRT